MVIKKRFVPHLVEIVPQKSNFDALLKIIINQQLSNKVADVIFLRLKNEEILELERQFR